MVILEDQIWMIVVGFLVAFVLAFGLGANDVANTFGSSVGSGVLTLKQACILATICEMSGAVLLGAKVSNTLRKGIVDIQLFSGLQNGAATLMAGQVAALGGSCIWLLVATFLRLPVSGTHSIVGATVGFSLVIFGVKAIQWMGLVRIGFKFEHIPLWGIFILSAGLGCITVILVKLLMIPYLREKFLANESTSPKWSMRLGNEISKTTARLTACCRRNTFSRHAKAKIDNGDSVKSAQAEYGANRKRVPSELAMISENPLDDGTEMQPVFSRPSLSDGSETMNNSFVCGGGDHVPGNSTSSVTAGRLKIQLFEITPTSVDAKAPGEHGNGIGSISAFSVQTPNVDFADGTMSVTKRTVLAQPSLPPIGEEPEARDQIKDRPSEARVFSLLQVMTAVFGSFAHGGNDVSNAIGPLIGLWIVGVTHEVDSKMPIPVWLLVYGGVGISIGLCLWGRRVIQTLGEDLARITPSSGVCIEIGSALTVLLASKVGLPVSTTHCQVGSVVGVGRARSRDNVNWSIFRNIIIAWVVTVPAAAGVSALLMYCFTFLV
ncbi:Phosphate transporter [Fasciola gigantica]|uniref:Phosphate transporter n=1 Tax=Fasciola gigantica TaxID=46835 RepID=A0A504YHX2_FASGI|nr:Phosphate transporter [Fasciola gigantica]